MSVNQNGYRCLDLNMNKIILSRHVTFDETVFPYGSMTPYDSPSYTFLDTSPNIIHQHIISKLTSASPLPTTTITSTAAPPSPPRSPLQTVFPYGEFEQVVFWSSSTPDLMARALDHLSNCELPLVSLRVATSKVKTSESKPKSVSEPLIEDWKSDSENENETQSKSRQRKHSNVKVEFVKSNEHVKSPRESVKKVENNKQAKYPRKNSQSPKGNKRNWNNLMTQKLGCNFEFKNKACYVCGSFNHLIKDCDFYEKKMVEKPVWNNARRVNHQNSQRMSHPHPKGNFVPKAVLMKSSLKTLNTARQNSSRAAISVSVNTAKPINTAYPRPTVNSAKPASNFELQEKGVIDSGCSRHMTGNMSYLFDYEEIDGGYVAFGENPKGGKITGKGKISIGKLDFEDVYFVKELKFNLFSVSQMCKKRNSVLFTNTECVVLSLDFKLLDENQVLLKVPRKNNMYSVDLKNVAPLGGLTCLFAKATLDESNIWHRRLGHINFKTMNKLNGAAKRKNRTLIEAARTMLADSKLPTAFWAEVVNIAYYVQNRVLVIKPHNKTPYEHFHGRTPSLSFMRPFGCHVIILNTLDHLGKFDGKADEEFFIRYSMNSKAFKVFNSRTRIVEETLHITFLENKPNVARSGPTWLFDIDTLTKSMNYKPVIAGNQSNGNAGTKGNINVGQAGKKTVPDQEYILLPLWTSDPSLSQGPKNTENDAGKKVTEVLEKESGVSSKEDDKDDQDLRDEFERLIQQEKNGENDVNSTNNINTVSSTINTASTKDNDVDENIIYRCADDPNMPNLEEIVYSDDDEDVGA
ncbi:ribonuclease H-like domain-containing protein [Tanacetum coccineum]